MGKLGLEIRENVEDLAFRAEMNSLDYRDAIPDIIRYGSSWKGVDNMTDRELLDYLKEHFEQFDEEELADDPDYQVFQKAELELLVDETINDETV